MKKLSKWSFFFAGVMIVGLAIARLVFNSWMPFMWGPLAASVILIVGALVSDFQLVLSFLTMRTTKHGMNMGVLILVALVGVVAINFIAVRNDKKFDWTTEKLNSLSEQSVKAAKALTEKVEIVLLINKLSEQNQGVKFRVKQIADMYRNESSQIDYKMLSAVEDPGLAKKYEFTSGEFQVLMVKGEKHVKVDNPPGEENFTKALVKLGRNTKQTIYFTQGHGERGLDVKSPEGLSAASGLGFKDDLENLYNLKTLNLVNDATVPNDAAAVVIVGPKTEFLDSELTALRTYARKGGRFFIAIDPATRHNLANLTKTFGVEFKNTIVLDPAASVPGQGPIAALGMSFDKGNEITRDFPVAGFSIFLLASPLQRAVDAPKDFEISELVKTSERAVAADGLEGNSRIVGKGPLVVAMSVKGKLPTVAASAESAGSKVAKQLLAQDAAAKKAQDEAKAVEAGESKEFHAVIVGDSDFVSSMLFGQQLNRDLAMNAMASLTKDSEVISIRPKTPKGTSLNLTREKLLGVIFGFVVPLPILLMLTGSIIWWRRRTA